MAPAALTVCSGSAFAQASMTCVSKQVADPVLPGPDAPFVENYLRVRLYGLGNEDNVSTWIKGAEFDFLTQTDPNPKDPPLPPPYLSSSQWQCVSTGTGDNKWVIGKIYDDPEPRLPNGSCPEALVPVRYVAVRVDEEGKIIGVVGTAGNNGSAVGWTSCWASFTGVARYA
jgi:hypothetical protein